MKDEKKFRTDEGIPQKVEEPKEKFGSLDQNEERKQGNVKEEYDSGKQRGQQRTDQRGAQHTDEKIREKYQSENQYIGGKQQSEKHREGQADRNPGKKTAAASDRDCNSNVDDLLTEKDYKKSQAPDKDCAKSRASDEGAQKKVEYDYVRDGNRPEKQGKAGSAGDNLKGSRPDGQKKGIESDSKESKNENRHERSEQANKRSKDSAERGSESKKDGFAAGSRGSECSPKESAGADKECSQGDKLRGSEQASKNPKELSQKGEQMWQDMKEKAKTIKDYFNQSDKQVKGEKLIDEQDPQNEWNKQDEANKKERSGEKKEGKEGWQKQNIQTMAFRVTNEVLRSNWALRSWRPAPAFNPARAIFKGLLMAVGFRRRRFVSL